MSQQPNRKPAPQHIDQRLKVVMPDGAPVPVPFSEEAEQATIAATLINPELAPLLMDLVQPDDFYLLRHRYIWTAICSIVKRTEEQGDNVLDYVMLVEELRRMGKLEEVGSHYLVQMLNMVDTTMHAAIYASIVARAAFRRRLLIYAEDVKALALDETTSAEEVDNGVRAKYAALRSPLLQTSITTAREGMVTYLERMQAFDEGRLSPGLPIPFAALRETGLDLFQTENVYVFAGATKMGKTWVVLNTILKLANLGVRTFFATLEMNVNEVTERLVSIDSRVPTNIQQKKGKPREIKSKIAKSAKRIAAAPIYMDDSTIMDAEKLLTKAKRVQAEFGLDLLVVDYLQKMTTPPELRLLPGSPQEISYNMQALKRIARELHIPVIVAVQLNRAPNNREDKRPRLADLHGSSQIEKEAAAVIGLYREAAYDPNCINPNIMEMIVLANRFGPMGASAELAYDSVTGALDYGQIVSVDLSLL